MNKVYETLLELNKGNNELAGTLQFGFMDGSPSDFSLRKGGNHVIGIVFGQSQSLDLKQKPTDCEIIKGLTLKQWKEADGIYRKSFKNSIKLGRVKSLFRGFILRFDDDIVIENYNEIISSNLAEIRNSDNVKFYKDNGIDRVKLLNVRDKDGNAVDIDCKKLSVLLLWAELGIMAHEFIEYEASQLTIPYNGLVICSDFLSGNGPSNGDNFSAVVRASLETAYKDRIAFVNTNPSKEMNGEILVDNIIGLLRKNESETGSMQVWTHEYVSPMEYFEYSFEKRRLRKFDAG